MILGTVCFICGVCMDARLGSNPPLLCGMFFFLIFVISEMLRFFYLAHAKNFEFFTLNNTKRYAKTYIALKNSLTPSSCINNRTNPFIFNPTSTKIIQDNIGSKNIPLHIIGILGIPVYFCICCYIVN